MASSLRKETNLLAKHYSVYGLSAILGRVISFLLIPVYTSYITPTEYGAMELIQVTISLIETVIGAGLNNAMHRYYFDSDDQRERNSVVSTAIVTLGSMTVVLVGVMMLFSTMFSRLVLDSSDYASYFYLAFGALGLGIIDKLNVGYFRVNKKSGIVLVIEVISLVLVLGLNVYFLVVLGWGVWGIFVATFIGVAVRFLVLTPLVLYRVGLNLSREYAKGMFKYGLPLIPSNLASYIVNASDRYFIKEYVSVGQTGIYSLSYRLSTLVNNFITQPFIQIWTPRRFEMWGKEGSEQTFCRIFTYYAFLLVFSGMMLSALSRELVMIMADESYWDAYTIIPILTLANVIFSFFYHFNVSIVIEKKTIYFAYINIANAVLNLILNFVLISRYGVWGAAIATLVCHIFRNVMALYYSNRLHKVQVEWGRLTILMAAGIGYYFVMREIDIGSPMVNLAVKTPACLLFPLVLYALGFFAADERAKIHEFIRKASARIRLSG